MTPEYRYRATILRWVDGDTVDVVVDLGFRVSIAQRLRLYGVDTPERGESGAKAATAFVNELAPVGSKVTLQTYDAREKYGRFLAEVFTDELWINEALVEAGHAVTLPGKTALSWPERR